MPITRNRPLIESYSRTSFINTLVVKHLLRARVTKVHEQVRTSIFNESSVISLEFWGTNWNTWDSNNVDISDALFTISFFLLFL